MTTITEAKDLHLAWAARFNAGDVDGMLALSEPGSVFSPAPGEVASGAGYRAALEQFVQMKLPIALTPHREIVVGDLALLIYDWSIEGTTAQGDEVTMSGTTTDVARKGAGGWRFVIDNPFGIV